MMAGRIGYKDVMNFSDDAEMLHDYFGLIARGDRYFLARYINVNTGTHKQVELTQAEAEEIQNDFRREGWTLYFVEKWISKIV